VCSEEAREDITFVFTGKIEGIWEIFTLFSQITFFYWKNTGYIPPLTLKNS